MIKWHKEIKIPANIETVWRLFDLDRIQRIMPNVIAHEPIELKEGVVGSTYRQTYKEGKRTETYIVTDIEYENTDRKKHKRIEFVLGKAFKIQAGFTLIKEDENLTTFIYTGQNEGINFLGRSLLKLGGSKNNDKVVDDFVELVRSEAAKG
ncbi:SRPBCC family protein [Paenibacillus arenilitoris]|uniref:SRPBCC family protein n=1 Tax=Paenibacillus arenilitoris TaxID=2772299 RepID=A0A927CLA2_9BACL|nr:SRPBCC family protein [Paenibacillus arenilitoris]MBD2868266.1 SRPBCC family protein [Paenibacillus arenilitoris]